MTRRNDIGKHLDLIFRTTVLGQKVYLIGSSQNGN